jgi:hypothetical protein
VGRALAIVGGMRAELVDAFPGERRDYVQMALILLVTMAEAITSACFATYMVMGGAGGHPPAWLVAAVGVGFGLMILTIDRYLALGLDGQHGLLKVLPPTLIRAALAVIIGLVMSTPLVLAIFAPEIEREIAYMELDDRQRTDALLARLRSERDTAQEQVQAQQQVVDELRRGPNPEADPAYVDSAAAWNQAAADCEAARTKASLELHGLLLPPEGTGRAGFGDMQSLLAEAADSKCQVADAKKVAMFEAYAAAAAPDLGAAARLTQAETYLDQLVAARNTATATLETSTADATQAHATLNRGLLRRLEALDRLSQSNPLAGTAHLAVLSLLAAIEVLPVLVKAMKAARKEQTAYERHWRLQDSRPVDQVALEQRFAEADAEARLKTQHEGVVAIAAAQRDAEIAVAADWAKQEQALQEATTREIVKVQTRLLSAALAQWSQKYGVAHVVDPEAVTPRTGGPEPTSAPIREEEWS